MRRVLPRVSLGALLVLAAIALAAGVPSASGAAPGATAPALAPAAVRSVVEVGVTVGDLDRSVAFFTGVLQFEKLSESDAAGAEFERVEAVKGARARVARLRLGRETLVLTQYLQ